MLMLLVLCTAKAQIKVSDNARFLATHDGKPFFWLGDTDWELFHRLTREEAEEFIAIRSEQGYNVLQVVALAEFNGIRQPNRYGDVPLNNEDPTQLLETPGTDPKSAYEYDYWDHVDFVIRAAAAKGMYIGLLPTWGDKVTPMWGDGPKIFNEKNAEVYGAMLAKRYAKDWNILWILGGDRPAVYTSEREGTRKNYDDRSLWKAMAKGIESVLGKQAFITYHPAGGSFSTSQQIHDAAWLDMNAFQSGHGSREAEAWDYVTRDLALTPTKPTLDMEPCYEDHPVNPWDGKWTRASRGYFTAYDVRARIYRGVFAGACGVTYGHHQIWQFMNTALNPPINPGDTIIPWQKAARAAGASEMLYLKDLMLSRPYFSRIPDQTLIASATGTNYVDKIIATRDSNGAYAFVYLPQNKTVKINLGKIGGTSKTVWWFDPRTGKAVAAKPAKGNNTQSFTPPHDGKDWVLVIDDASKKFPAPGTH
ncbi:glycoside hydrolase family 140 protein [Chryseolinea sp. Jin1]|uniref:Glycoside hydrolase family 140 protein n=2 Tax=Chryseolinea lacunae TaxID=2801331 RepID=A0ABS1KUJ6_9BACT|nr:glycoside hydrolase family 140 protein [Chryseolinea lacunae]